jgi:TetR/AcrR family transcriptional regulator, transcriptional repressor for nem operon
VRYKADQKRQTCERITRAAGRCFRKNGYAGIGVDGLAKEAGVTSGAFYVHFQSKADAFKSAVLVGMTELHANIDRFQQEYGKNWWAEFTKFYLGPKRKADLAESCVLQSLTIEVGRCDSLLRERFETELLKIVELASQLPKDEAEHKNEITWAILAMLIGGVTLARAVKDEKLADEIASAINNAVNNSISSANS